MRSVGNTPRDGEVRLVASDALADGDKVILKDDGTVGPVGNDPVSQTIGTAHTFASHSSDFISVVYDSHNECFVIVYRADGQYDDGSAMVAKVLEDHTLETGSRYEFSSNADTSYVSCCFDSSKNKIVAAYRNDSDSGKGYVVALTVDPSNNSVSYSTPVKFSTNDGVFFPSIVYDSNADRFHIAFRNAGIFNIAYSVVAELDSSDNFTIGAQDRMYAAGTNVLHNYTYSVFDPSNNRVVTAFRYGGDGSKGYIISGAIDPSNNSTSYGTPIAYSAGVSNYNTLVYDPVSEKVIIVYANGDNNYRLSAVVATVSGNSISVGNTVTGISDGLSYSSTLAVDSSVNKVLLSYKDGGNANYGYLTTGTVNGTSISFNTPTQFVASAVDYVASAYDSVKERVGIFYENTGNSAYGTANLVRVPGNAPNLTSNNYIGIAKGAASDGASAVVQTGCCINDAQAGLTAGQQYFVQKDNTLGLTPANPSVFAGTAVSATKLIVKG